MARSIPIIQLYDNLLVSIQVELSDALVNEMKENLAQEIVRKPVTGLIIELSGVDTFDSYIARAIRDTAHIARLMGVHTVVAGFDAAAATTLVEMGMRMDGVDTALCLEAALELLAAGRAERAREAAAALQAFDLAEGPAPTEAK
jgi:rsbT antagonist protein RsbS